VEVHLQTFPTWASDIGELSASYIGHFAPRDAPVITRVRGWVVPRAGLGAVNTKCAAPGAQCARC